MVDSFLKYSPTAAYASRIASAVFRPLLSLPSFLHSAFFCCFSLAENPVDDQCVAVMCMQPTIYSVLLRSTLYRFCGQEPWLLQVETMPRLMAEKAHSSSGQCGPPLSRTVVAETQKQKEEKEKILPDVWVFPREVRCDNL